MIFGLTERDLQRIDKKAVKNMIEKEKERLKIWSIPNYEKQNIKRGIEQLEELLNK